MMSVTAEREFLIVFVLLSPFMGADNAGPAQGIIKFKQEGFTDVRPG